MPALTALRRVGPGRVQLEVDGRRWRTVSDDVVVRAGLAAGLELDRPTLRRIRGELGRARARGVAARALARRDLSRQELESRLERAHVGGETAAEIVEGLAGVGAVDDERVARARAEALAARGWGDAALAVRLESSGLDEGVVRDAVALLEPEPVRARRVAAREADPRRAARLLARRGFAADTIEEILGAALD